MPRGIPKDRSYVATETFAYEVEPGQVEWVRAGETRVAGDHALLENYPHAFEVDKTRSAFEVEQATAAPGEKRGAPAP